MKQFLKKLSKRDRRALIVLGGAALAVLLVVGVVLPFYEATGQIGEQISKKQELLDRYIQAVQQEEVYRSELADVDRLLADYEARLLDTGESSIATVQLEEVVRALASEHGIEVTRSNPLQERKIGESYIKITLQVNLRSDVAQLTNFLHAISSHPKFLLVENFFLNSFRSKATVRIQPRMNVSGFIRLS